MRKIAIWGFGVTGQASLRYFLNTEKYNDAAFDIYDGGPEFDLTAFRGTLDGSVDIDSRTHFYFNTNEFSNVSDYELILISPGISPKTKTIERAHFEGVKVINDVALFLEEWHKIGKSVGVTGSNGKSTTVNLIYGSLQAIGQEAILVGNIGTSPLDYLADYSIDDPRKPIAVMELSSFQLETFQDNHYTDIGVILNITPNHLDRHGDDIQEYTNAKMNIFNTDKSKFVTVFDDEGVRKHIMPFMGSVETYGISLSENIFDPSDGSAKNSSPINKLLDEFTDPNSRQLKGQHNLYNIAVALQVLQLLGVELPNHKISEFMKTYSGLEHRIELVREIDGVKFINDSKSTSPDATRVALESFGDFKNVVLIAGGKDKNVSFESWNDPLNQYVKKMVILDHDINDKLIKMAEKNEIKYVVVPDIQSAVDEARADVNSGDYILLSPGASSFGRFVNYEDRGKIFKEVVNNIK